MNFAREKRRNISIRNHASRTVQFLIDLNKQTKNQHPIHNNNNNKRISFDPAIVHLLRKLGIKGAIPGGGIKGGLEFPEVRVKRKGALAKSLLLVPGAGYVACRRLLQLACEIHKAWCLIEEVPSGVSVVLRRRVSHGSPVLGWWWRWRDESLLCIYIYISKYHIQVIFSQSQVLFSRLFLQIAP